MFSPKDEVLFLNEPGKGTVIKALGNNHFLVLNDLGFEQSYPGKLLVAVNKKVPPTPTVSEVNETKPEPKKVEQPVDTSPAFQQKETRVSKRLGNEKQGLITGLTFEEHPNGDDCKWTLFIFNASAQQYYFTAKSKIGISYIFLDHGIIEAGDILYVSTFHPIDITDLKEINVQAIVFHSKQNQNTEPVNDVFKIKLPKLYTKSMFTEWAELDEKALILKAEVKEVPVNSFAGNNVNHSPKKEKTKPTIKLPYLLEKEIDLHIEKLYPNHNTLASHEKLNLQLKAIKQTMDEAIVNHYKKVTFIHGVGNGKLKDHTRKIVASYAGVSIADGDYGRYGFGATTVFLD